MRVFHPPGIACCARIVYLGCANLAGEDNRNVARMPRGLNASTD
jgi:hypothetical protein